MKKKTHRLVFLILIALSAGLFFTSQAAFAYIYGRVGPGPEYPDDGTITFMAYLRKAGDTDNEILTEDNWNCSLGTDNGYSSEYFFVDWESFTVDLPINDGDTMVILFTGIGAEIGNSGSTESPIDIHVGAEQFPSATWGASLDPSIPASISPICIGSGIVHLSWFGTQGSRYRVYRSSQASGAGNGASNGRYRRLTKDLTRTRYVDSTAPLDTCWYLVVAEDDADLSGHSLEARVDAAVPTDTPPPVPTILLPPNGANLSELDSLVWSSVIDPDPGDVVFYILEIDDDSTFLSPEILEEGIVKSTFRNSTVSVILGELCDYDHLVPGTRYYWQVEAMDNHGVGSEFTAGEHYFFFEDAPPEAIDDLVALLAGGYKSFWGSIFLSWTEPCDDSGVEYYIIYRSTLPDQVGDSLAATTGLDYLDVGAAGDPSVHHFYTVKAIDVAGNSSPQSNKVGEFDKPWSMGKNRQ